MGPFCTQFITADQPLDLFLAAMAPRISQDEIVFVLSLRCSTGITLLSVVGCWGSMTGLGGAQAVNKQIGMTIKRFRLSMFTSSPLL
ncbi:hypothetical protein LDG_8142 [Legionella drancourtii LLAP12]|uniref:Uncharacterized protein n=1 Tax=Legionella drancourtii LLAP12 TaxID=658187 RepID=G9ES69_9GAMM|nr:hypothetical protein LDG_8142 [Legionella drancourtii LLAP12]